MVEMLKDVLHVNPQVWFSSFFHNSLLLKSVTYIPRAAAMLDIVNGHAVRQ